MSHQINIVCSSNTPPMAITWSRYRSQMCAFVENGSRSPAAVAASSISPTLQQPPVEHQFVCRGYCNRDLGHIFAIEKSPHQLRGLPVPSARVPRQNRRLRRALFRLSMSATIGRFAASANASRPSFGRNFTRSPSIVSVVYTIAESWGSDATRLLSSGIDKPVRSITA